MFLFAVMYSVVHIITMPLAAASQKWCQIFLRVVYWLTGLECVGLLNDDIVKPHRTTSYVDAAYCYRLTSVVCLSQSWALQKWLNRSRCHLCCGLRVEIAMCEGAIFWGKDTPAYLSALMVANALLHGRCCAGIIARGGKCVCPREGWQGLANTIQLSVWGGDAAFCQITLTTCYKFIAESHTKELKKLVSIWWRCG